MSGPNSATRRKTDARFIRLGLIARCSATNEGDGYHRGDQCLEYAIPPRVLCRVHETACAMCNRSMGPHLFRGELHP